MTKERYLDMCEQLGTKPLESEMPLEYSDFPYIVQLAMSIFSFLPDRWEGFSGTYLGKDFALIEYLMSIYEIDDKKQMFQLISIINSIVLEIRSEDQKRKQAKKPKKG